MMVTAFSSSRSLSISAVSRISSRTPRSGSRGHAAGRRAPPPFTGPGGRPPDFDLRSQPALRGATPARDVAALQELVQRPDSTAARPFSKPLGNTTSSRVSGTEAPPLLGIHHSIGDGIALVRVLLSMARERMDTSETHHAPHGWERLGRAPAGREAISRTIEVTEALNAEGPSAGPPRAAPRARVAGRERIDARPSCSSWSGPPTPFKGPARARSVWLVPADSRRTEGRGKALGRRSTTSCRWR